MYSLDKYWPMPINKSYGLLLTKTELLKVNLKPKLKFKHKTTRNKKRRQKEVHNKEVRRRAKKQLPLSSLVLVLESSLTISFKLNWTHLKYLNSNLMYSSIKNLIPFLTKYLNKEMRKDVNLSVPKVPEICFPYKWLFVRKLSTPLDQSSKSMVLLRSTPLSSNLRKHLWVNTVKNPSLFMIWKIKVVSYFPFVMIWLYLSPDM